MRPHETYSTQSEWYTPRYIFVALNCIFDLDVASPSDPSLTFVPAKKFCSSNSLSKNWEGFVWCNPPWAGRGNKQPWINKICKHGNGLLLTPDRSSALWWQYAARKANAILFVSGKIQFIAGPGNFSNSKQPGNGTTIFGWGKKAITALLTAQRNKLGIVMVKLNNKLF